jgi:hypothetical protein
VIVEVVICPPDGRGCPDLALMDALARLQLAARRLGWSIRLRNPTEELCLLLDLVGLVGVLPLETGGETEGGEQLGIEEVVQPRDPPV